MIRVYIVDDQALVRAGLAMVIDAQDDMTVVGEAGDGAEALESLRSVRADVVLMDIRMSKMDGVEATRQLLQRPGAPKVLVLTTFDLDEYALAALRAGASGFLLKDALAAELAAAVRTVHRGDAVIAPSTTRRLVGKLLANEPVVVSEDPFTPREREVLLAVAHGHSNAEIGARLFMSEATVKTHVGRILAKLGLRDRVQIVIWAYEHGLVRPGQTQV